VPGRNPGTSTNVSTGTLNASQVRTNRDAFSEASMSRCAIWKSCSVGRPSSIRPERLIQSLLLGGVQ
jgi:hypothetical protein